MNQKLRQRRKFAWWHFLLGLFFLSTALTLVLVFDYFIYFLVSLSALSLWFGFFALWVSLAFFFGLRLGGGKRFAVSLLVISLLTGAVTVWFSIPTFTPESLVSSSVQCKSLLLGKANQVLSNVPWIKQYSGMDCLDRSRQDICRVLSFTKAMKTNPALLCQGREGKLPFDCLLSYAGDFSKKGAMSVLGYLLMANTGTVLAAQYAKEMKDRNEKNYVPKAIVGILELITTLHHDMNQYVPENERLAQRKVFASEEIQKDRGTGILRAFQEKGLCRVIEVTLADIQIQRAEKGIQDLIEKTDLKTVPAADTSDPLWGVYLERYAQSKERFKKDRQPTSISNTTAKGINY